MMMIRVCVCACRVGLTIKQNKHVLRAQGGSLFHGLLLFIF